MWTQSELNEMRKGKLKFPPDAETQKYLDEKKEYLKTVSEKIGRPTPGFHIHYGFNACLRMIEEDTDIDWSQVKWKDRHSTMVSWYSIAREKGDLSPTGEEINFPRFDQNEMTTEESLSLNAKRLRLATGGRIGLMDAKMMLKEFDNDYDKTLGSIIDPWIRDNNKKRGRI